MNHVNCLWKDNFWTKTYNVQNDPKRNLLILTAVAINIDYNNDYHQSLSLETALFTKTSECIQGGP